MLLLLHVLVQEAGHLNISIICEKLTYVGVTCFEDDTRLPLGVAVNSASYAAKALTHVSLSSLLACHCWLQHAGLRPSHRNSASRGGQEAPTLETPWARSTWPLQVAVDPRFLKAYMQLGVESDLTVQDASSFAGEGEELSFLQLQARAASVRQVLLGYYRIPATPSQPLELVINPQGLEERTRVRAVLANLADVAATCWLTIRWCWRTTPWFLSCCYIHLLQTRVWNAGDCRCKLVTLAVTKRAAAAAAANWDGPPATCSSSMAASFSSCDE